MLNFLVQYTVLQIQQAAVETIPARKFRMSAAFDDLSVVHHKDFSHVFESY